MLASCSWSEVLHWRIRGLPYRIDMFHIVSLQVQLVLLARWIAGYDRAAQ